jgi:hypothetical protein
LLQKLLFTGMGLDVFLELVSTSEDSDQIYYMSMTLA